MSDYNFQVYTPDGKNAISSIYNSYYIATEGSATLTREDFQWDKYTTATRAVATIAAPSYTNPNIQPLLLLKNNNKAEVGGFLINHTNGVLTSWKVVGGTIGGTFDYAIAVAETGPLTSDKYGLVMYGENGTDVLYDSRRRNNLLFRGVGFITDGYFEEGPFTTTAPYDYFSAPIFIKQIWMNLGSSGGIYSYALGTVCFKGTGPQSGYATAYVSNRAIDAQNYGSTGGSPSGQLLFFSKLQVPK